MRPIFAIIIPIVFLGGVFSYLRFVDSIQRPPVTLVIDYAEGEFEIEIERSFDCTSDPILGTESLVVKFKGSNVYATQERVPADEQIVFRVTEGVETGENEIYLIANREFATDHLDAVKIVVRQNGISIAETVLVSEPGIARIAGPIVFESKSIPAEDHHDDD